MSDGSPTSDVQRYEDGSQRTDTGWWQGLDYLVGQLAHQPWDDDVC